MTIDSTTHKSIPLSYLPDYAQFLLNKHLSEFALELLRISREENIPLLRYFSSFPEDELVKLSTASAGDLLRYLSQNNLVAFIERSTDEFLSNRLPNIEREEIVVEDITIVSLVRRKAFRNFLPRYTSDIGVFTRVMEDVDRFVVATEAASFNAYNCIQQENIIRINKELAMRQEELLEAQDLAGMGSFFWDLEGTNSAYTPGALKIFALTGPSNIKSFFEDVHLQDRAKLRAAIDKAFTDDGLYECEYTYTKDGIEKRISSRGTVNFVDGKPVSMKGTVKDITKEYQLLQKMMRSDELHKQAQAITHIGNWSWDIINNTITWSDEMYRIYGLEPQSEEISFERFLSLIHPDDRDKRKKEIEESLATLEAVDYFLRIVNPDGAVKMLKGKGEIITDNQGQPVLYNGTCQDVTREYLLNQDLQEKEQNLKQLIRNAPDGIIVIDPNSNITLWNPKSADIFGWTAEEVIGKKLTDTIIPVHYKEAHEQGIKRYLRTGEAHVLNKTLELVARNKEDKEVQISLTISETTQAGETAFIAFIRDISSQKETQAELQKKTMLLEYRNEELKQINKELESFNFAASHDLQEPLRKLQTYSSRILQKNPELPPQIAEDMQKIQKASARMQQLMSDLLSYSQNTPRLQDTEEVDLKLLIEEVKNNFLTGIDENRVVLKMGELPSIRVVRFQFLQLFLNLFTNAIKYQVPGNAPVISINSNLVNSDELPFKGNVLIKKYLRISVGDNGIGFEQQYAEKIFNLFTRLHHKDEYSGTGIGLATCKKIVQNHEGFIEAVGEPGKGATFNIYLPEECLVR